MKKVRCPKCDERIIFDETPYEAGRILVFECPQCHKRFKVRIKQPDAAPPEAPPKATLVVVENAFQLRQEINLQEGDNYIGRYVKGTPRQNAPIITVDPSIDPIHCVINLRPAATESEAPILTLRDGPSGTGTFHFGHLLPPRQQTLLHDADIITLGAATLIVCLNTVNA